MIFRTISRKAKRIALIVSPFLVILAAWQLVSFLRVFPEYLFPSPASVLKDFIAKAVGTNVLFLHVKDSLIRLFVGYLMGIAAGMIAGMAIGLNKSIFGFLKPLLDFAHAIPGISWLPLAILWLGIDFKTIVFMVFLVVFFPVFYGTLTGINTMSMKFLNVAAMCGATKLQTVLSIVLPGALPSIINGVRVGAAYGWRGLIAVEMIIASTGIGWLIIDARAWLKTETVILGAIIIGLIWICIDQFLLKTLEARTIEKWGMVQKESIM